MNKITETQKAIESSVKITNWNWAEKIKSAKQYIQVKKPNRIIFVGTGSSYHVALWSTWLCTLTKYKHETLCFTSWEMLSGKFKPNKTDLLIFISHRGYQGLTEKLSIKFKAHSKVLICAQGMPTGSLINIQTVAAEKSNAHTISLLGAMLAILNLFSTNLSKVTFSNKIKLQKLSSKGVLYFVGAGIMSPIAFEAALKAREMAKMASCGYQLEEFLHGPAIALKKSDTIVLIDYAVTKNQYLWNERVKLLKVISKKSGAKLIHLSSSKYKSDKKSILDSFFILRSIQKSLLNQALQLKQNPDINPFA